MGLATMGNSMHFVVRRSWLAGLACTLVLAPLGGCWGPANPHGYIGIQGTVTFDGQPMHDGHVTFLPVVGAELMAGSPVQKGRFSIPPAKGLPPGDYRVSFTVMEETDEVDRNNPDPLLRGLKIRRNAVATDWTEEASTQVVTISGDTPVAKFVFTVPRAN